MRILQLPVESKTQTHHGRIGSGRWKAELRGVAGPGRTERRRVGSPRTQPSLLPPNASKAIVLNVSSEARPKEVPCKPMEEQSPRFIRGSSAVYPRFIRRTSSSFLAAHQCTDALSFVSKKTQHTLLFANSFLFRSTLTQKKRSGYARRLSDWYLWSVDQAKHS